jgi:hypothetical protein
MNNQYISRYSAHQTHFNRTDPFTLASFAEEEQTSCLWIVAAMCGLFVVLLGVIAL